MHIFHILHICTRLLYKTKMLWKKKKCTFSIIERNEIVLNVFERYNYKRKIIYIYIYILIMLTQVKRNNPF